MDPDDYMKRAADVFHKIGKQIRTTVGIKVGSIALELEKTQLRAGDVVRARVTLKLPEPTSAKRLVLAIRATQPVAKIGGSRDQRLVRTDTVVVWKHHLELAGARDYVDGESFDGEITIPADIFDREVPEPEGALGQVVRAVQAVSSATRLPLEWRAMALLDIPWKRNIKKLVDITVSKP